ncbi:unnamed protein product [Rotaria sp. Silwood2]|nr:unnamed protein product [Rotaria sp. Silwood2]CAF3069757.1 unnamed protein product [Rotaria sp. Silwood2]CAF4126382.1 unnamed protein product [Rotaria sp. Silwood2]CAF4128880.1 unnamed protein product [Rotaria sp. Silwood2]
MGHNSTKLSNRKFKKTNKNKKIFCCLCTSHSLTNSLSSLSCSIDEKYFPTFDRIVSNNNHYLVSIENIVINVSDNKNQSNKKLNTTNINQWINSLPILESISLNHTNINQSQLIQEHNLTNDNEQLSHILAIKSNREFLNVIKKFQLNFYLEDYQNRLKNSKIKQTFKQHFSSSTIINPSNRINQLLIDDLNLFIISSPESILPNLFINTNNSFKIHEQLRSKCYFIPLTYYQIEPNDDEYKQKSIPLDRTHVVITLENNQTTNTNKTSVEYEPLCIFTSNDSFQTGFIHINQENISKEFLPFISYYSEDNVSYLSSNLIQQWFNTLILVNQTCNIVQQFLKGDGRHITCLLKEQTNNQSNKENLSSSQSNLIFAALRLPSCKYFQDMSSTNIQEEKSDKISDAFSPIFLSDNKKISSDFVHIDYEQYSFAFILHRWPKILIDNYYIHPNRYSKRQWPSQYDMNIIIKKSLLLIPDSITNHKWKINFDLIEENLFELMNESTLFFYMLCQQLFSQTYSIRIIIKHCFLNYCEKYGLPFSNNHNNILDLINHFLKELSEQINKNFFPNYFNHEINLLNSNENYNQWFDYINKFISNRIDVSSFLSSSLITISNRSIIIEFLFYFIDQLYQTLHIKQSQFYLNDNILLDLHKHLCEKLSNDNQNKLSQKFMNDLLNNKQIITNIQMNLTYDYETNAELVHICLNQIRKAQTSLIFHYTWTVFIQYLHTYYNVLWNI